MIDVIIQEVARLCSHNPLPCLMAAKVCLEHLNLVDDGFNLATEAAKRAEAQGSNITSRCHFFFLHYIIAAVYTTNYIVYPKEPS